MTTIPRHEEEVDANREVWRAKPLLREVYGELYRRAGEAIDRRRGPVVEIGSGVGSFSEFIDGVIATDYFVRPWLDVAADAYALPFVGQSVGTFVATDVLHHLQRPMRFLAETRHALVPGGRLILIEPYISATGWLAYGCFHDEPVAWRDAIDPSTDRPPSRYYAAQGNATRLFFGRERSRLPDGWRIAAATPFASFAYLLSGGFSRSAFYPRSARPLLGRADAILSRWPALFAARAVIVLERL